MTKILIGAGDLRDLIAKHPQIEMELVRTAVPQIAEVIRKQAAQREPLIRKQIEETFNRIVLEHGQKYGMSDALKAVIRVFMEEVWLASAKELALDAARKAATEVAREIVAPEIEKARRQIAEEEEAAMRRVDLHAKEAAEREVLALLRAGNLTIKA